MIDYRWWMDSIVSPYGKFVFVEHLVSVSIFCGVVAAILLGLFYKPNPNALDRWVEKVGVPLGTIILATFCLPILSIMVVAIFPVLLGVGSLIGGIYLLYWSLSELRQNQNLIEGWRETVKRKGDGE